MICDSLTQWAADWAQEQPAPGVWLGVLALLGGAVCGHGFPTDISRLQGDPWAQNLLISPQIQYILCGWLSVSLHSAGPLLPWQHSPNNGLDCCRERSREAGSPVPALSQIVNIHDKTVRLETALSMGFIIHGQYYAAGGGKGKLVCLKAKTGELKYQTLENSLGSVHTPHSWVLTSLKSNFSMEVEGI